MKYKEAKKTVEDFFMESNIKLLLGWRFRLFGRKGVKKWAKEALEGEK